MASPSSRDGRRVLYGGTAGAESMTGLAVQLLVRAARQALAGVPGVAVSHTSIMDDPGALVVDFTEPAALTLHPDYCEQLLLLSPRRGVLVTTSSQGTWERLLTHQAEQPDGPQILKLCWRRSTRGGRPWVLPQAITKQQAADMSGDWSALAGPARSSIHLSIQGDTSTDHRATAQVLIQRLLEQLHEQWQLVAVGAVPRPRELAPVAGADGLWDGAFILEAADPDHAKHLASFLNGMCFAGVAGSRRIRLSLQHEYAGRGHSGKGSQRR